jgi:hypothetical protein
MSNFFYFFNGLRFSRALGIIYHDNKIISEAIRQDLQHINPGILFHIAAQRGIDGNKIEFFVFKPIRKTFKKLTSVASL